MPLISVRCPVCHTIDFVVATAEEIQAWSKGALVQNAFPHHSPEDRERLVSGTCPSCWDEIFQE